jgi:23S rRNA (guanine1835-N2)-methyltransferase
MEVPQGKFDLVRFPYSGNKTLRAWDAADEYLLAHLSEMGRDHTEGDSTADGSLLILNDGFGALSVSLADRCPQMLSDSYLSHLAVGENLARNAIDAGTVTLLGSLDEPRGPIGTLIAKVPKTLALLEDQLHRVRPLLVPGALVVGAGMTRNIHSSTIDLFEKIVGPTTTTLARKKARLILARVDAALDPGPSPYPTTHHLDTGLDVVSHANVFSRKRLDIGTRLLLEHLPQGLGTAHIIDLGCGNGILGTVVAQQNPDCTVVFADESFMALRSAEATFRRTLGDDRYAEFLVTDALDGIESDSVDLILNNPPFHDGHVTGDAIAWRMFVEARRALCSGGELYVVGNRHLGYHEKLKRIFGNSETVGSNPKFVVLRAVR